MNKHRWLIVVVALAAVVGMALFALPVWQTATQSDTEAPNAPDFGSSARVDDPRIVLPERAGDPARIYLDLVNVGDQVMHLTEVRLPHGSDTEMQQTGGPAWKPVAALPIAPGATLSLHPGGEFAVVSGYDSEVVPGANIDVVLVFGTSKTITVPARVLKAVAVPAN